jgi:PAS domain S-box-containing protein
VLLPNAGIFLGLQTALREWPLGINFVILTLWFVLNLLYFRKIQPVINRAFNRSRNSLVQRRMAFLEEISLLKNLDELSAALTRALSNGLGVDRVAFYIRRHQDRRLYQQTDGTTLNLTPSLERYLVHGGHLIERDRLETFVPKRREVQAVRSLFERTQAAYLIPMVQEHQLLAVALLSEKTDGLPLNSQESYFIREIKASGTIALFNSILYQNVTDLRDRLQQRKITLQQEIRDREKVQQALQNSERQYRLLAENILDVIWIINLDRNAFAYISPSVTHLTGYDPQEAVKLPLNQVMTEASLARMRQEMRTRGGPLAGGEPRPFWIMNTEVELIRKDGSTVWVEISASPLKDRGIAYNAILGITRDITDRRQRMEMQHAKVAAEKASQAKSEFLANMSHELRTPLNHIIGFTELVVDQHFGTLNETQADYLNDVLQSSHHLLELINDILDLSKVEAGKMALQKEALELAPLLENGLGMIKEKSLRHNIRLKLDIQDAPAIIQADQRKIKQILYNLLSNAVKFTPDGGEICLSATQNPGANGSGSFLEVSVRDTGIGIAAADLERIFNTFEQVENSAARHYEGTGLGLALTRRLVKLHGGRIRAESEGHDRGSRFVVALPVEESRQPACDH